MSIAAVMIDSREPRWVRELRFGGVPTTVLALETGDVQVATSDAVLLIIERKTPSDLLNSLRDERLLPQCAKMRDASQWCYLLITGELRRSHSGKVITARGETGWDWNAVWGALLTIQEMGVGVTFAAGDDDFEGAVMRLAARKRAPVRILPPRPPRVFGAGEAAIAALPGVGLERLDALLEYAGSPAMALVALTEHGSHHVPGIGPGTRRAVRRALGLDDDLEFYILPTGTVVKEVNE